MTIVIAGYEDNDIFFIADSAITSNNKTLLSGFKKVYSIPINLHKPYINRTFYRYIPYKAYEGEAVLALAGSTLTAQHIINSINEHLGKIRFIHKYNQNGIQYSLLRHCNTYDNPFYKKEYTEYVDVYRDEDLYKSIKVQDIKNIIEYSIKEALSSASKHVGNDADWKRIIENEYLFALHCPITKRNFLYQVELKETIQDGIVKAIPNVIEISKNDLAIIGLKNNKVDLESLYKQLVTEKSDKVSLRMLDALENLIDAYREEGNLGVSKPITYKKFNGKLTKDVSVNRNGEWIFLDSDDTPIKIIRNKKELQLNNS